MWLAKGKRDFYAGGLIALIGAVAIEEGLSEEIGSLIQMGPGFMPLVLGIVLMVLGIAIAASAKPAETEDPAAAQPSHNDWRAWLCIVAGPALFIVLGEVAGYVPATLVSVFVAAMGDRSATLKSAATLSACVTVFGGLLFIYLLNVPFPLFRWGTS
jgi:putative Ca2+/H+ antiporter (TMEM165/GDT1 family)